jgi:2-C-methyl-D-erythritol 4-phosphate cytidylyltransferase
LSDTLKRTSEGRVLSTVDRAGLATTQTPQAFVAARLRAAHRGAGEATDDAGLLELEGATVRTVPGDPRNLKLTRAEDLVVAEALMAGIDR